MVPKYEGDVKRIRQRIVRNMVDERADTDACRNDKPRPLLTMISCPCREDKGKACYEKHWVNNVHCLVPLKTDSLGTGNTGSRDLLHTSAKMNSALSHNLSTAISRVAPAFKINSDEVSRRLLAALFPIPSVVMPMAPPPPVVPAPAPKPAAKVPVQNLVGLNPTQQKKFKQIYEEFNGKTPDNTLADVAEAFLVAVNQMPAKEYAARPPQEHMREFLRPSPSNAAAAPAAAPPPIKVSAPPPKPAEVEVNENCVAVMYKGTEYWVGEESKRVYLETSEGVHEFRGVLGLAEFDAMEMPVDEV